MVQDVILGKCMVHFVLGYRKACLWMRMFCAWTKALQMTRFTLDLFGHHVIAHMARSRSRWAHSKNK